MKRLKMLSEIIIAGLQLKPGQTVIADNKTAHEWTRTGMARMFPGCPSISNVKQGERGHE